MASTLGHRNKTRSNHLSSRDGGLMAVRPPTTQRLSSFRRRRSSSSRPSTSHASTRLALSRANSRRSSTRRESSSQNNRRLSVQSIQSHGGGLRFQSKLLWLSTMFQEAEQATTRTNDSNANPSSPTMDNDPEINLITKATLILQSLAEDDTPVGHLLEKITPVLLSAIYRSVDEEDLTEPSEENLWYYIAHEREKFLEYYLDDMRDKSLNFVPKENVSTIKRELKTKKGEVDELQKELNAKGIELGSKMMKLKSALNENTELKLAMRLQARQDMKNRKLRHRHQNYQDYLKKQRDIDLAFTEGPSSRDQGGNIIQLLRRTSNDVSPNGGGKTTASGGESRTRGDIRSSSPATNDEVNGNGTMSSSSGTTMSSRSANIPLSNRSRAITMNSYQNNHQHNFRFTKKRDRSNNALHSRPRSLTSSIHAKYHNSNKRNFNTSRTSGSSKKWNTDRKKSVETSTSSSSSHHHRGSLRLRESLQSRDSQRGTNTTNEITTNITMANKNSSTGNGKNKKMKDGDKKNGFIQGPAAASIDASVLLMENLALQDELFLWQNREDNLMKEIERLKNKVKSWQTFFQTSGHQHRAGPRPTYLKHNTMES
eukprot:g2153.t1